MASRYTSLGTNLWNWRPWTNLESPVSRLLWIALYTSPSAKRLPPGLYSGSVNALADESHLDGDSVRNALDDLRGANLIEWDQGRRLVRLTQFPDALERATNPSHLRGWWNAFRTIEVCRLRDSHVTTLRWLLEQGVITDKMEEAWLDTFGHPTHGVKAPVAKRSERPERIFAQSSLFPLLEPQESDHEENQGLGTPCDTPCTTPSRHPREAHPQDQDRDQDQASRGSGDVLSGSGSGQGEPPVDRDQRPRLALVPLPVLDDRERLRREVVSVIGQKHAKAFARVKGEIGSTALGPSVVGKFDLLRELLDEMPVLEGALERCEYALAIREAEAIEKRTMQFFGPSMWKRDNFDKALTFELAEVNGTRTPAGRERKSVFEIGDEMRAELEAEAAKQTPGGTK